MRQNPRIIRRTPFTRWLNRFCDRTLWILIALAALVINARLDAIAEGKVSHKGQAPAAQPMGRP